LLRKDGLKCEFVGDWKRGAKDLEVIERADKMKEVIITEDKDFGELIFKRRLKVPGIILFRTTFTNPKRRYLLFKQIISKISPYGNFIVIEDKSCKSKEIRITFIEICKGRAKK